MHPPFCCNRVPNKKEFNFMRVLFQIIIRQQPTRKCQESLNVHNSGSERSRSAVHSASSNRVPHKEEINFTTVTKSIYDSRVRPTQSA